jgi:hypothetical protein
METTAPRLPNAFSELLPVLGLLCFELPARQTWEEVTTSVGRPQPTFLGRLTYLLFSDDPAW